MHYCCNRTKCIFLNSTFPNIKSRNKQSCWEIDRDNRLNQSYFKKETEKTISRKETTLSTEFKPWICLTTAESKEVLNFFPINLLIKIFSKFKKHPKFKASTIPNSKNPSKQKKFGKESEKFLHKRGDKFNFLIFKRKQSTKEQQVRNHWTTRNNQKTTNY